MYGFGSYDWLDVNIRLGGGASANLMVAYVRPSLISVAIVAGLCALLLRRFECLIDRQLESLDRLEVSRHTSPTWREGLVWGCCILLLVIAFDGPSLL